MIITYPPGYRNLSIKSVSHFPEEEEVLTYPGERLKVVRIVESDGARVLYLEPAGYVPLDIDSMLDTSLDDEYLKVLARIGKFWSKYMLLKDKEIRFVKTGLEANKWINSKGAEYLRPLNRAERDALLYTLLTSGRADQVYLMNKRIY